MIDILKESLWRQFGASIDMLGNAIVSCPDELLATNKKFFYNAYHCLIFLDYYLTNPPQNFTSPLPFTIKEPADIPEDAIDDIIPDRIYSKAELLGYLQSSRDKCHRIIASLTEEKLNERWKEDENEVSPPVMDYSLLEILLYNMRHVQHHSAQLNLFLRQAISDAPKWVGRTQEKL